MTIPKRKFSDGTPASDGTPCKRWHKLRKKWIYGVTALVVLVDDEQEVCDARFWRPRGKKSRNYFRKVQP